MRPAEDFHSNTTKFLLAANTSLTIALSFFGKTSAIAQVMSTKSKGKFHRDLLSLNLHTSQTQLASLGLQSPPPPPFSSLPAYSAVRLWRILSQEPDGPVAVER